MSVLFGQHDTAGSRFQSLSAQQVLTPGVGKRNKLSGWVDSDISSDIDTHKSVTGYLMVLNGGPVSGKASRQGGVTMIISEAEFIAASQAGRALPSGDPKKCFTFGRSLKDLPTYIMVLQRSGKITRLAHPHEREPYKSHCQSATCLAHGGGVSIGCARELCQGTDVGQYG